MPCPACPVHLSESEQHGCNLVLAQPQLLSCCVLQGAGGSRAPSEVTLMIHDVSQHVSSLKSDVAKVCQFAGFAEASTAR